MSNRLRDGFAVAAASATLMVGGTGCDVEIMPSSDPLIQTFDTVASQYNLDARGLLGLAACESTLNENATNGTHDGLLQQSRRYWLGRYERAKKKNPAIQNNIRNGYSNLAVSAEMMTSASEIKRHWECESKYKCYSAPLVSRYCKPELVEKRLSNAGTVALGGRVVVVLPKSPSK
ncbi:hypothetical protein KC867_00605 [Candidatus Saccharibacteria bacterium]|nr:hypothetical protein [Candidatus Saccharibacteria bacterium]